MTENEWLDSGELYPLLTALDGDKFKRKLRLFSIACCRRISNLICDSKTQEAIELAEQNADGKASIADLRKFRGHQFNSEGRSLARAVVHACAAFTHPDEEKRQGGGLLAYFTSCHASAAFSESIESGWDAYARYSEFGAEGLERGRAAMVTEFIAHRALLRDIIGNPFRPVAADRSWLISTVAALAEGIYQDCAFDRMPILADALQDAGCDNEDILSHCRSDAPHVRGCWVVDLLLGKT